MNNLKFKICFVLMIFSGFLRAKPEVQPEAVTPFVSVVKLCEGVKHIYVNYEVPKLTPSSSFFDEISHLNISKKWDRSGAKIRVEKQGNGFEIEFINETVTLDDLGFAVDVVSYRNQVLASFEHGYTQPNDEMVDVSVHLDRMLGQFNNSRGGMVEYFCGQQVSQVELLAFFQEYLSLSEAEMCNLIKKYKLSLKPGPYQVSYTWVKELCDNFRYFLNEVLNGSGSGSDKCHCKLIRTNPSALNIGSANSTGRGSDECNDYEPRLFANNYGKFNDDDLIISTARLGAAKASAKIAQYDGGDNSPDPMEYEMHAGRSEISFRSVCVDPSNTTPNLNNCDTCDKRISLNYALYSRTNSWGNTNYHIDGPELAIRADDWAMMTVLSNNEVTVPASGFRSYIIDCDGDDDLLSNTIIGAEDLIGSVSTAISNVSIGAVVTAATEIIAFADEFISSQSCDQRYILDTTMIAGSEVYFLEPGGFFKAVMTSGVGYRSHIANNGKGEIIILSDFHMEAVVETIADDETGDVPDYCECERIGAYALGSIDQFDPLPVPIWNDEPFFYYDGIFQDVPFGDHVMRQEAGAFIGPFGNWEPKWEQDGCCSPVLLECQSECAYLSGCDLIFDINDQESNGQLKNRLSTTYFDSKEFEYVVSPNPFGDFIRIKRNKSEVNKRAELKIYNSVGQLLATEFFAKDELSKKINTSELVSGIYVISIENEYGNKILKKLIK